MEIRKFRLVKKWWKGAGKYLITDSSDNLIYKSSSISMFKTGIKLVDEHESPVLSVKTANAWNTAFAVMQGDLEIAHLKKISTWSSKEYGLYTSTDTIQVTSKNWGKQINFSKDGKDVAHASAKGSMWTDIGLVVKEDEDAELYLICVVLICYLKSNGYA